MSIGQNLCFGNIQHDGVLRWFNTLLIFLHVSINGETTQKKIITQLFFQVSFFATSLYVFVSIFEARKYWLLWCNIQYFQAVWPNGQLSKIYASEIAKVTQFYADSTFCDSFSIYVLMGKILKNALPQIFFSTHHFFQRGFSFFFNFLQLENTGYYDVIYSIFKQFD